MWTWITTLLSEMWVLQGWRFLLAVGLSVGLVILVLAVLHQASNQVKRAIIVALTFTGGLFYMLEFFIPPDPATEDTMLAGWNMTETAGVVGKATLVVGGFTFLLGVYNLVLIHGNNVRRLRTGWGYSIAFFVAFAAMTLAAFWRDWHLWFGTLDPAWVQGWGDGFFGGAIAGAWELFRGGEPPSWILDQTAEIGETARDFYTVLFEGLLRNLEATMFSILAFYIVSAAYRAFRIRSAEAAIMMVVAVILMLGQVPIGMVLTNWIPDSGVISNLRIENFSQYILTAINSPVQRAIDFGIGLGFLAMSLRIWLSLERGTYFGQEV